MGLKKPVQAGEDTFGSQQKAVYYTMQGTVPTTTVLNISGAGILVSIANGYSGGTMRVTIQADGVYVIGSATTSKYLGQADSMFLHLRFKNSLVVKIDISGTGISPQISYLLD